MYLADGTTPPLPLLIIVSGPPCTGKTTLARRLAERFCLPLVTKDGIKETLFDCLGWRDRAWSRQLGGASMEVLYLFAESLVAARQPCIVEGDFHAAFATPAFQRIQAEYPFLPIQINCVADPVVLAARFRARALSHERHPGHQDHLPTDSCIDESIPRRTEPLDIGGVLMEVDTTDFDTVNYSVLFNRIQGIADRGAHMRAAARL
jgi:predicted kinase